MTPPPAFILIEKLNELLKASGSNRKVHIRLAASEDVLELTVYDPDAGMYYTCDVCESFGQKVWT
jgi:hypothetical protein